MIERGVQISVGPTHTIHGDLVVPDDPVGLVGFAHGSGSSRRSVRNRQVAEALQRRGVATFLFDLLTDTEERADRKTGQFRFDVTLLAERLLRALAFLEEDSMTGRLPFGLFGASTGAAGALAAAARRPDRVAAVVSRGGRPDLAGAALVEVRAPTLLIVGGRDQIVLDLNQEAATRLRCPHELVVVPGATHLFEEPGALDQVARLAADWFTTYLRSPAETQQGMR